MAGPDDQDEGGGQQSSGGINIKDKPADLSPRSNAGDGDEGAGGGTPPSSAELTSQNPLSNQKRVVPISKAAVSLPIQSISRAAAILTEYPPLAFNNDEANRFAEAVAELGMEVSPAVNVMLLGLGMIGGRMVSYALWKRAGKPAIDNDGNRIQQRAAAPSNDLPPSTPPGDNPLISPPAADEDDGEGDGDA